MISKVVLAKLSPTMEEGTIVSWNKNEGDAIKVGDVLAVIETDKANMEMEALGAGVLRKIFVPAGGKAPIGSLIGVIADANEDISALLAQGAASAAAPSPAPAAPTPAAAAPTPAAPPMSAPVAAPAPVAAAPQPVADGGRVKASPLARNVAARQNVPLQAVTGSGPGGRIIKRDVEAYVASGSSHLRAVPSPASATAPAPAAAPGPQVVAGQEIALSSMRKVIAKRLSESAFGAPHFYVTVEIDMDKAVALREQVLAAQDAKVSYNDFIVMACAKALARFPMVNASWGGDKIVTHAEVHVGVAVALPDGLITPVVRNADRKGLAYIAHEVRDLAARARDKKLKPEEYTGSTFTISNLGMFDVDQFTAIINPPDSAILAVGSVKRVPVVDGETIRPGHRMKLTLSSDHRVIDGALAAQFLQEVRRLLENPIAILL
jgi:pyruvate dehydrogenase E2 component (dihydrolipoamide acetyltransferase)